MKEASDSERGMPSLLNPDDFCNGKAAFSLHNSRFWGNTDALAESGHLLHFAVRAADSAYSCLVDTVGLVGS